MKKHTKETFIEKARELHGDTYNYNNSIFVNTKIKVEIVCQQHDIFWQSPEKHLQGQGCPKCKNEKFIKETVSRTIGKSLKIDNDWLKQKYITENLTQKEIAKILNIKESTLSSYMIKIGITKEQSKIKEAREQTNFKKFGTKTPAENIEIKSKMILTSRQRYGTDFPINNSEIKNKIKATMLSRWGVQFPIQNLEIKNKIRETILKRLGVEHPIQNLEIKNKIDQTMIKRYNFKRISQSPEYKEKIKVINLEKYGLEYPVQSKEVKEKIRKTQISTGTILTIFNKTISEWSLEFSVSPKFIYHLFISNPDILEDQFISIVQNYKPYQTDIESLVAEKLNLTKWDKKFHKDLNYKPDFKISEKTAINVDGLYWHSEANKNSHYHFNMRKEYEKLGLRIFQFRANEVFENLEIIKSMIDNSLGKIEQKIGARKTKIKLVNNILAKDFLKKNHLKGYKTAKHLGLFYNDELISIMSYKIGISKKDKSQFLKIERFCSKIGYNIAGAFSKLFKTIEKEYVNIPIHYWVDLRYGTGNFLLGHGFQISKETLGWDWTDNFKIYNRLQCRANMDNRKLSEKEYAKELGWHKIWDAGQRLYIKKPS